MRGLNRLVLAAFLSTSLTAGAAEVVVLPGASQGHVVRIQGKAIADVRYEWIGGSLITGAFGTNTTQWYRAGYALFDLSSYTGTVTSASLKFSVGDYRGLNTTVSFFDVATDAQGLVEGKVNLPDAWLDLKSGAAYGEVGVQSTSQHPPHYVVQINEAGLAAINGAQTWAVGSWSSDGTIYMDGLQLVLSVSAVPEPSSALLSLLGLACVGVATRRTLKRE